MNKAILVGNLTKDPEMRTTPNGVSVTSFTVAVNRRYKSQDGQQQTDFINCVALCDGGQRRRGRVCGEQGTEYRGTEAERAGEQDGRRIVCRGIVGLPTG